jgi:hypothetical protein
MATHKDLDTAFHALTHREAHKPRSVEVAKEEPRVLKELHIRKLHDGSLHHTLHHENGMREEGSTHDLDDVHDALEEHFGEPNTDEEESEGRK